MERESVARRFIIRRRRGRLRIRFEDELNEQQLAAVTAGKGPKLVIAGAGSGKTRTITYRLAYLIDRGVNPRQVMLVTFTNKAAREMLTRAEALVGADVRKVWGGTFHAIGNRILRQNARLVGYQPNYSILDEEDQRDMIKLCLTDLGIKTRDRRFPSPAIILDAISFAFNTRTPLERVIEERYPDFFDLTDEILRIEERYAERKRRANAMDYDDLLGRWWDLLQEHPKILEKYGRYFKYILVDEYQDTNKVQADIVELIAAAGERNLMVVGDDCQSIYAFRGANYDNILKFPERNPDTEIFRLEINYRSTPQILDFTNDSINKNTRQYHKVLRSVRPPGPKPVLVPVPDVYAEASFVCDRILELQDEGLSLNDIAVLYRAHSHAAVLERELVLRGIPYEVRSGVRFFEQAHIKDVVAYLKVLDNGQDEAAWRRLMLMVPRIGNITARRVWEIVRDKRDPIKALASEEVMKVIPRQARDSWERFAKDMAELRALSKEASLAELIEAVLETDYADYMKARYPNYGARMDDIEQLGVFARKYDNLRSFLTELVIVGELYGQDVIMGPDEVEHVVLSSIHQAKGLEWRHVFVIRMVEGAFPSTRALREPWGEEEERRIFYVAITRAADELYITYPQVYHMSGTAAVLSKPSRFITELDESLYEEAEVVEEE